MDCSSYHTVSQRLLRASKYLLAHRPIKFRQAPGTHLHCCLNTVFPSTNSSWLEPLSTRAGSVYKKGSWEFSPHILADLDLGLKLHLGYLSVLFSSFHRHCSQFLSILGWLHGNRVPGGQGTGIQPSATGAVGCSSSHAYLRVVQAVLNCRLQNDKSALLSWS